MNKLRFYLTMFNDDVDPSLDIILNKELDSGISKCCVDSFYIKLTFNTGVKATLWNANQWYAWVCRGNIGKYTWDGARPRRKTMWRLKKEIEKYVGQIFCIKY